MVMVRLMRNGIPCHSRDKAAINSYEEAVPRIIMERCLLGLQIWAPKTAAYYLRPIKIGLI